MNISLSPETQKLLEEQMRKGRFTTPDEAMQTALRALDGSAGEDYAELSPETLAAIEQAEAQYEWGEGRPWEEVREELLARFVKR